MTLRFGAKAIKATINAARRSAQWRFTRFALRRGVVGALMLSAPSIASLALFVWLISAVPLRFGWVEAVARVTTLIYLLLKSAIRLRDALRHTRPNRPA